MHIFHTLLVHRYLSQGSDFILITLTDQAQRWLHPKTKTKNNSGQASAQLFLSFNQLVTCGVTHTHTDTYIVVITRSAAETCHWPWTTSDWNSVVSWRKCQRCCCCCHPCTVVVACSLLLATNGQLSQHRQASTATMASFHWNKTPVHTYISTHTYIHAY